MKEIEEIKPLSDFVIIDMMHIKPIEKTKSGIVLAASAQKENSDVYFDEHPYQGIVYKVGPGYTNQNGITNQMRVKEGDHVLLTRMPEGSQEMMIINSKVYACVREHMISAIIKLKTKEDEQNPTN